MPYPHDAAKLKSWEAGISAQIARDAAPWNDYDAQIKTVCAVYNKHLAGVSGYVPLDWQLIKAIAWVESGAANAAWKTAPMQIGVNGDPGLRELLTSPTGKLILPPEYAKVLTVSNVPANGNLNFEAGVGYVLKITANFGMQATAPPSPPVVLLNKHGAQETTEPFRLMSLEDFFAPRLLPFTLLPEPPVPLAHPPPSNQLHAAAHHATHPAVAHHKGSPRPVRPHIVKRLTIVGWKPRTLQFIAKHYNAGDGNYADKLQFALDLMSGKIKPEARLPPAPKPVPTPTPMRLPQPGRQ